jgi:hypothetical protein
MNLFFREFTIFSITVIKFELTHCPLKNTKGLSDSSNFLVLWGSVESIAFISEPIKQEIFRSGILLYSQTVRKTGISGAKMHTCLTPGIQYRVMAVEPEI